MITPLAASYSSALDANIVFPDDSKYNYRSKLLLSVHMYSPYNFALNGDMAYTLFIDAYREELYDEFTTLYKKYVSKGHNVVIGEMGTVNKNNTNERIEWAKYFVRKARKFHMTPVLWDNNAYDNSKGANEIFGHFHRDTLEWEINELMDTYISTGNTEFEYIDLDDLYAINPQRTYNREGLVRDTKDVDFDDSIRADQVVEAMKMGWNLGNTFDAFDDSKLPNQGLESETCCQKQQQKDFIQLYLTKKIKKKHVLILLSTMI
jgi:hypothetical protein